MLCLKKERNPTWDVRLVNVCSVVGSENGDKLYNLCMERSWFMLVPIIHCVAQLVEPVVEPILRAKLTSFWDTVPSADVVVSLVPFLNPVIIDSCPSAVKHFTVLTDFTHSAGHPWLQDHRQTVLCGTEESARQGRKTKTRELSTRERFFSRSRRGDTCLASYMVACLGLSVL